MSMKRSLKLVDFHQKVVTHHNGSAIFWRNNFFLSTIYSKLLTPHFLQFPRFMHNWIQMFSTIFYLIFFFYYKYLLIQREKWKLIWFFIQTESQLFPCIFLLFILLQSSIKSIYTAREPRRKRGKKSFTRNLNLYI